ncbi:ChaN family lipoprotein [Pseudodesulfovibrio sediminis]|uniref:PDZ domain-containing protein n=1 Tax=Pseudodesulfovibrio sediminis TaxID=2810563 RepID=A0ABM7P7G4_9BACT|nr:ChaN family lipoprotein [Pseudodesulfovibrio sediminis]BCS88931.1 PDZ domain-containing protein [Pseudodesulfovibrio sediminis]
MGHNRGLIFFLLMALLTVGACVKKAPEVVMHPPLDVTFLPQRGDFVSQYGNRLAAQDVVDMAASYDYVLIGEGHRNVWDHKIQQQLLSGLSSDGKGVALGLEMVAVDMQPVLNDFAKGLVEPEALSEELEWPERWGYSFSMFKDLFVIARRNSVPIAGLNMPSAVTRKISREGRESLTEEEAALLPATIVPPSSEQRETLDAVFALHETKDMDDPVQRERFYLVQSLWDSKMAEEAVRLRREFDWPVLIIAGAGHVEQEWGIAMRLRQFDPGARVLSIMPWRGGEFDASAGDVFFYSPDTYESKMGATLTGLGEGGILVEGVKRGSRAAKAGLRPGDVLVEASGMPLDHLYSLHVAGTKVHEVGEELVFTVRRGTRTFVANVGKLGVPKAKTAAVKPPVPVADPETKEQ